MQSEFKIYKKKKICNFCFRYFETFLDNFLKYFDYEILGFMMKEIRIIETKYKKLFFYSCYEYFMNYQLVGHIEKDLISKNNLPLIKKFISKINFTCNSKKKIKLLQKFSKS